MEKESLREAEFAEWWEASGAPQLAEILYWRWDPIGVTYAFPNNRGEYDDYLEPIVTALRAGGDALVIEDLLLSFERDRIGFGPGLPLQEEQRPEVAVFIAEQWFENSISEWRKHGHRDWRHA